MLLYRFNSFVLSTVRRFPRSLFACSLAGGLMLTQGLVAEEEPPTALVAPGISETAAAQAEELEPSPLTDLSGTSEHVFADSASGQTYNPQACGPVGRGCIARFKANQQALYWGFPEFFIERPFGDAIRSYYQAHVMNGIARQRVLYQYDFFDGPGKEAERLKPRGQAQVLKLAQCLSVTESPIVIEKSPGNPQLDAARRENVLKELKRLNVTASPDMVVVGQGEFSSLTGRESEEIHKNQATETNSRGSSSISGRGTAGSMGAGGGMSSSFSSGGAR
jgi:hypothetical protein